MAIISVRGHEVDVNIREELDEFEWGYGANWTENKLIASSPFRLDSRPSFYIDFEGEYAGVWGDSGATTEEERSGTLPSILAYLRGESVEDAEDYLLEKYGILFEDTEDIRLPEIKVATSRRESVISSDTIIEAVSPYLLSRRISTAVQTEYGVGYNPLYKGFTAIPWYNEKGQAVAVKYRSTSEKTFFYEKGGTPISHLIYGLTQARNASEAVIVEAEIDALSWASVGVRSIALGSASISRRKLDLIRRSGIKKLILGGDNDSAGRLLNERLRNLLRGDFELSEVNYEDMKDANAVLCRYGEIGLHVIHERQTSIPRINIGI